MCVCVCVCVFVCLCVKGGGSGNNRETQSSRLRTFFELLGTIMNNAITKIEIFWRATGRTNLS